MRLRSQHRTTHINRNTWDLELMDENYCVINACRIVRVRAGTYRLEHTARRSQDVLMHSDNTQEALIDGYLYLAKAVRPYRPK